MSMPSIPKVGAPDPELKTSPIIDDDEEISLDHELASQGCYFNDVAFGFGDYVRSGAELLCCTRPGVWVRKTEVIP